MADIKTTFTNSIVKPASGMDIKPTLGTNPNGKPTDSGFNDTVTPVQLPENELFHNMGKK